METELRIAKKTIKAYAKLFLKSICVHVLYALSTFIKNNDKIQRVEIGGMLKTYENLIYIHMNYIYYFMQKKGFMHFTR